MRRIVLRVSMALAAAGAATLALPASMASADFTPAQTFVIGNGNSGLGTQVEFWGAQWAKDNTVSGGDAPDAFKGFAVTVTPTGPCQGTFTAAPGNSGGPPDSVDTRIQVLVTDSVTKDGDVISGTYTDVVFVLTDDGYGPDPGHAGTGVVDGSACGVPQ